MIFFKTDEFCAYISDFESQSDFLNDFKSSLQNISKLIKMQKCCTFFFTYSLPTALKQTISKKKNSSNGCTTRYQKMTLPAGQHPV